MYARYNALVADLKALTQGESPDEVTLPMAEDGWAWPRVIMYIQFLLMY